MDFSDKDRDLYDRALKFAEMKHRGQKRKFTGEPYIVHPVKVAGIVKDNGGSIEQVAAALLHDTIEDTDTTREEIEKKFGPGIAKLVISMTNDNEEKKLLGKAEYLAKKISGMDKETLLIKLADRLDNAGDLEYGEHEWSAGYAVQTRYILDRIKNDNLTPVHIVLIERIREKIKDYLE